MKEALAVDRDLKDAVRALNLNHSWPSVGCPKCVIGRAVDRAFQQLQARDARISKLESEVEQAALDAITVEEQRNDLARLRETIDGLEAELDAQRRANDALRDRMNAELEITQDLSIERASLRSQRDALLAANGELQDVIRQLV